MGGEGAGVGGAKAGGCDEEDDGVVGDGVLPHCEQGGVECGGFKGDYLGGGVGGHRPCLDGGKVEEVVGDGGVDGGAQGGKFANDGAGAVVFLFAPLGEFGEHAGGELADIPEVFLACEVGEVGQVGSGVFDGALGVVVGDHLDVQVVLDELGDGELSWVLWWLGDLALGLDTGLDGGGDVEVLGKAGGEFNVGGAGADAEASVGLEGEVDDPGGVVPGGVAEGEVDHLVLVVAAKCDGHGCGSLGGGEGGGRRR